MSSGERVRVMIVDDHAVVRLGLSQLLEQTGEFEVVGQAVDGEEAVRMAANVSPDLVMMDVMMPGKDGVEACREIMESAPETLVVMLTASPDEDAVVEAVAAGAVGYVPKEVDRERLLSVVRDVVMGELRLPSGVVRRVFAEKRGTARMGDVDGLTPREREILTSFARGMSYARIAEERGIQPVTVRNAVYGIQHKLGVGSMQELVLWAAQHGLVNISGKED
ncbi:MAG: response regulator transcription factor [Chloroflexi bacterium]|nr:response regulator transcription factor [Chloroflexota bacterium]